MHSKEEVKRSIVKDFYGVKIHYDEVYYLDYEVNEDTGKINRSKKVKYYTKDQVNRNLIFLKKAIV